MVRIGIVSALGSVTRTAFAGDTTRAICCISMLVTSRGLLLFLCSSTHCRHQPSRMLLSRLARCRRFVRYLSYDMFSSAAGAAGLSMLQTFMTSSSG
jgi:hypothetical protein